MQNAPALARTVFLAITLSMSIATSTTFAQNSVIEEVVVTATKREQTLQEVPVAVTVTTAETIERARINDILDLQSVVPSLRVPQFQSSTQVNFVIRGFGNGANNVGIEPSVGVFIDGVYRSRSAAQIADLPNLERVEVLRGPQSTLFGKNASAGVISVITRKPEYEWDGFLEVGIEDYDGVLTKGYVTGPLSDTVAFGVGGSYYERDGYSDNLALGTDISDRNRYTTMGQLLIEPSDDMSLRIDVDYSKIDESCCTVANLVSGPTAGVIALLGGSLDNENPFSYDVYLNNDPNEVIENGGVSLHADFNFEHFTITSITAFRNIQRTNENDDVDYSSGDIIAPQNDIDGEIDTFTQELRIASNTDGPISWLAGFYYFDEDIDSQGGISFGPSFRNYADILAGPGTLGTIEAVLGIPAGTFFAEGSGVTEVATQDNQAYSLFGTLDWELTDRMVLTLGINHTRDEKEVTLSQINTDVFSQIDLDLIGAGGLSIFQFLPKLVDFPNVGQSGESDDSNTDYTVRLAYDWGDNMNVYASYATGFKATSWNISRDSRPTQGELDTLTAAGQPLPNNLTVGTRFASPEEATVYELGLKGQYETFSFNIAIFDQSLEDFQSNAFTGAAFTLTNAGETSVDGIEIETTWYPSDNLIFTLSGTFLDPVYDDFPLSAFGDISGEDVAGVAETSIAASGTWNWEHGEWNGYIRADYQYESEVQILDDPTATAILATRGQSTRKVNLVNASIGVSRGNYDLMLWGRNLTEDEFLVSAFPSVAQPGSYSGYPNAPRTYGLTFRANFN